MYQTIIVRRKEQVQIKRGFLQIGRQKIYEGQESMWQDCVETDMWQMEK